MRSGKKWLFHLNAILPIGQYLLAIHTRAWRSRHHLCCCCCRRRCWRDHRHLRASRSIDSRLGGGGGGGGHGSRLSGHLAENAACSCCCVWNCRCWSCLHDEFTVVVLTRSSVLDNNRHGSSSGSGLALLR